MKAARRVSGRPLYQLPEAPPPLLEPPLSEEDEDDDEEEEDELLLQPLSPSSSLLPDSQTPGGRKPISIEKNAASAMGIHEVSGTGPGEVMWNT
ncbi:hypothetical protein D3C72_1666350 [compost metagenome]